MFVRPSSQVLQPPRRRQLQQAQQAQQHQQAQRQAQLRRQQHPRRAQHHQRRAQRHRQLRRPRPRPHPLQLQRPALVSNRRKESFQPDRMKKSAEKSISRKCCQMSRRIT